MDLERGEKIVIEVIIVYIKESFASQTQFHLLIFFALAVLHRKLPD